MNDRPKTFWESLFIPIDLPFCGGNKSFLTKNLRLSGPLQEQTLRPQSAESTQKTFWQTLNQPVSLSDSDSNELKNNFKQVWERLNRPVGKCHTGPIQKSGQSFLLNILTSNRKL